MATHLYTDASFNRESQIAVSGYLLFKNSQDHDAGINDQSIIQTVSFQETTNIRAEIRGMLNALVKLEEFQAKDPKGEIKIYTDCQTITHLLSRRKNLEASGFISNRKQEVLPNADLYKKFFTLYDQVNPEIMWVKGHSAYQGNNLIRENFRYIDKLVRKKLRMSLKTQGNQS